MERSLEELETATSAWIAKNADACGGNWGAMILSAIKNAEPELYADIPNGASYGFGTLWDVAQILSTDVSEAPISDARMFLGIS